MSGEAGESEVLDVEHRPLAIREEVPQEAALALFGGMNAAQRAEEIIEIAQVFVGHARRLDAEAKAANRKPLIIQMRSKNGITSEHLTFELWQTLGALLPKTVVPFTEWSRPVEGGWEARVQARFLNGDEISSGESQCTRSESRWANEPDFAIRSMAQTRAGSKALQNALRFMVVLAGFSGTPAEEMPPDDAEPLPNCPVCGNNKAVIVGKEEYGGGFVCWKKRDGCGKQFQAPQEPAAARTASASPEPAKPQPAPKDDEKRALWATLASYDADQRVGANERMRIYMDAAGVPNRKGLKSVEQAKAVIQAYKDFLAELVEAQEAVEDLLQTEIPL